MERREGKKPGKQAPGEDQKKDERKEGKNLKKRGKEEA